MRETALFFGWGGTYPGREQFAQKTFEEFKQLLTTLKAEGEIERYETILLGPHGGELDGFTLVYGEPEKLAMLPFREELYRLAMRAKLDHAKISVIWATVGEGVERELKLFGEVLSEYEQEPALVG